MFTKAFLSVSRSQIRNIDISKIENSERDTDLGDVKYHKWCTIDGITQKVLIRWLGVIQSKIGFLILKSDSSAFVTNV